jgi:hypothetical protein
VAVRIGALSIATSSSAIAQSSPPDSGVKTSFGAFVDGYYAYDFGRPIDFDRPYTTQAARHNEFNIGLAFVEAKINGRRIRGRVALQGGTAVQANYAGEPTIGSVSGSSVSRFIQEAFAGYQLTRSVWIDGGIFFSWIGMESFISRDNLTYSRSLSADFTPYYVSGIKITWSPSSRTTALLGIINGWQNISETNQDKAVGIRLDYSATQTAFAYYGFLGNETGSGLRAFNGIGLKTKPMSKLTLQANIDYGTQQERDMTRRSTWWSAGLAGKLRVSPAIGVSARAERYCDPHQVVVATGLPGTFNVSMASVGLDVSASDSRLLWRNELRGMWAEDSIFPDRSADSGLSRHDLVTITSVSLTF